MMIDHLEVGVYVFAVLAIVWREKALDHTRAKVREAEWRELDVRAVLAVERWHHQRERDEHRAVLKAYEAEIADLKKLRSLHWGNCRTCGKVRDLQTGAHDAAK